MVSKEQKQYIGNIEGYCGNSIKETYKFICDEFVGSEETLEFVEVGVYQGKSLCHLAMYAEDYGLDVCITGVDNFAGNPEANTKSPVHPSNYDGVHVYEMLGVNLWALDLYEILILQKSSVTASMGFSDESIDFVFIDAGHGYKDCKRDIEVWYPKVKTNGYIAGHNYSNTFPGVKRAVDEKFEGRRYFHKIENCWIYKKVAENIWMDMQMSQLKTIENKMTELNKLIKGLGKTMTRDMMLNGSN
tara:strand:+ start:1843 stop:2577 length:735 start_codon:yes stop_codon:yes gene_type:complete